MLGKSRAPTLSKEIITCNTKTIKKQTLVHNLQKNPEKKYKILVILHPNRLQVRGKCKATSDYTIEGRMARERVVSQKKKKKVVLLGKNDLLHSTFNKFPSYNLKISGLTG